MNLKSLFSRKSPIRQETYVYVGDGLYVPKDNEFVGTRYTDTATGQIGVVVANTGLTITVEFSGGKPV